MQLRSRERRMRERVYVARAERPFMSRLPAHMVGTDIPYDIPNIIVRRSHGQSRTTGSTRRFCNLLASHRLIYTRQRGLPSAEPERRIESGAADP